MKLEIIPYELCVCKLPPEANIDLSREFYFIAKTDEEISLVCPADDVPECVLDREDAWRAFRLESPLDFSLTAILAPIASILAEARVPIFAVSTFNTDYVLVKSKDFPHAISLLSASGYEVRQL